MGDFFSIAEKYIDQFKEAKALKERIKHLQDAETYFKLYIEVIISYFK